MNHHQQYDIKTKWGKKTDKDIIAESWELSCHKDGESVISNGDYAGMTLSEFIAKNPPVSGFKAQSFKFFPRINSLSFEDKSNLLIRANS